MIDTGVLKLIGFENPKEQKDLEDFFGGCALLAGEDRRGQLESFSKKIRRILQKLEDCQNDETQKEIEHREFCGKMMAEFEAVVAEKKMVELKITEEIRKREAAERSLNVLKGKSLCSASESTQTPWNCFVELQSEVNSKDQIESGRCSRKIYVYSEGSTWAEVKDERYQSNKIELIDKNQDEFSNTKVRRNHLCSVFLCPIESLYLVVGVNLPGKRVHAERRSSKSGREHGLRY